KLGEAVRFLNEGVPGLSGDVRLAYRAGDSVLEFASESSFDRRERETRTYDLEVLVQGLLAKEMQEPLPKEGERHTRVAAEEAVCDQVRGLIEEMVHPPMWQNNGGDLASVRRFGSKMFVTAPRRHFQQVEWVLKECGAFEKPRAMIAPGSQKLSVDVDPATSELVIIDDRGATVRCRSLRMETPQLVTAMMEDARVQTAVPLLSELPLLNHNFRSEARLMTLMLRSQPDGTLEVQPALAPAAEEAPGMSR
ncbi:MAG TPA: hypothetical protein VHN77_09360, partial [Phycisphaerales bacterium]|nr:hypothetical protein [Phycisphaerales bacterium]